MTSRHFAPALLTVIAAVLASCGDPAGPSTQNDLVFLRADGTIISFPATAYVWCAAWEEGEVPTPSVHVFVGNAQSGWKLTGVRADIAVNQPIPFPNTFIWDAPERADLFIFDPPNELSTQSDDSSGSVTFTKLDCSTGGEVEFAIDAVVGSEFGDLSPVSVSGTFSGRVGTRPF